MPDYKPRVIDDILDDVLGGIGAVLLTGPKWCGKTTTATQHSKSILKMQDPDKKGDYLVTAETKPSLLLRGETPRLIDEWQMAPVLWDAVRNEVDKRGLDGQFILTGSTSVDESAIMHSGTGRIARLKMLPMSLLESGESTGEVSLTRLFNETNYEIDGANSHLEIEQLVFAACRGGWPASLQKKNDRQKLYVATSYVDNICESDISTVDDVSRDPQYAHAILKSYGRNISTLATNTTIIKDLQANFSYKSAPTFYSYINALNRLFVIEDVTAWSPSIRSASAIRAGTKKEFTDPSIAVAAQGLSFEKLLMDLKTFGFIFETLCIRDLKVYAMKQGGHVSYYHDKTGLEADAVLHLRDSRYALFEFKLGSRDIDEGAMHLNKLHDLIIAHNSKNEGFIPEPNLKIVITGGEMAYRRKDGVYVIPIGCIGV